MLFINKHAKLSSYMTSMSSHQADYVQILYVLKQIITVCKLK